MSPWRAAGDASVAAIGWPRRAEPGAAAIALRSGAARRKASPTAKAAEAIPIARPAAEVRAPRESRSLGFPPASGESSPRGAAGDPKRSSCPDIRRNCTVLAKRSVQTRPTLLDPHRDLKVGKAARPRGRSPSGRRAIPQTRSARAVRPVAPTHRDEPSSRADRRR